MTIDLARITQEEFTAKFVSMSPRERDELLSIIERQYSIKQDPTPGSLASRLDEWTIQTPALELLDKKMVGVRDAIQVMYERRELLAEMLRSHRQKKGTPTAVETQA